MGPQMRPGRHFPTRSPGALQRTQLERVSQAACLHLKYPTYMVLFCSLKLLRLMIAMPALGAEASSGSHRF